jgi:hypothetical protein
MQLEMIGLIEPDNSRFPCYRSVVRMLVTAYLVDAAVFLLGLLTPKIGTIQVFWTIWTDRSDLSSKPVRPV